MTAAFTCVTAGICGGGCASNLWGCATSSTLDYRTRQPGTARNLQNKEALRPGLSSGVIWQSDDGFRRGRHVDSREFGYDGNGYLCNLGHRPGQDATRRLEIEEHIFKKRCDDESDETVNPPWAEQRFGKEL